MSQTISDILVATLEKVGVKQIFGLIGDSLNPFTDSLRHSKIEWIGVRHEEGAALAAAGQAKLTGRLAVCCGTTGPGSTHLVSGLYEAARDHAPVLALSGDMIRKLHGIDYIQTTNTALLFRDVAVYNEMLSTAEQAPSVIHQAIAAAYAAPGVAHLTIPQDMMGATVSNHVSSLETLKPRPNFAAHQNDIADIVSYIKEANKIVIMCGKGCYGLAKELRTLSDKIKAPLIHSFRGQDLMAYDEACWMGGIGMIGTKAVYHAVMACDLFIMIGTDYPYSEFLPSKATVIQIDERPEVLGRRTPTRLGVVGSARPTLELLLSRVEEKNGTSFFNQVFGERQEWNKLLDTQADLKRSKDKIYPQALARAVSDQALANAIFVIDTGLNTLWSANWIRQKGSQRMIASFNNAAVGTALGQANGIQALERSRQVIVLCGDGGFNMLMCEFMTAVQHKLPVKVIIYNNSSFGLIKLEAESIGLAPYNQGIEFTNPDFAAFARACGGQGFTVTHPTDLTAALSQAFAVEGPAIVDVTVVANEIPNLPHLTAEMLGNVALAKVKEAILGVMGS